MKSRDPKLDISFAPWRVEESGEVVDFHGDLVAVDPGQSRWTEDRTLIAKAPEMLEALLDIAGERPPFEIGVPVLDSPRHLRHRIRRHIERSREAVNFIFQDNDKPPQERTWAPLNAVTVRADDILEALVGALTWASGSLPKNPDHSPDWVVKARETIHELEESEEGRRAIDNIMRRSAVRAAREMTQS